jgi:tetratricopeptide (TPR) repeat protein
MSSLSRGRRSFFWVLTILLVVLCFQIAPGQTDDPTDGETDPVKLFERGQNAHAKGDVARALALYEGALKLRPEFPEAEYQRGVALVSLERPAEAEKAFTIAIDLRKTWVLPISALGNLLARAARDKEAEPVLRRAIQLGARDSITLDSLSAVRARAGDKSEALTLAQTATADDNASASTWAWRGAMERASGNKEAAIVSLGHSLQIEPNYPAALKERAELYLDGEDYQAAIKDLKAALSLKTGDKEISLRLAHAYELSNEPEEAQRIYESIGERKSAAQTPAENIGATNVVGSTEDIAAANSDDPKIAQPALERLIITNPKGAKLFARLGEVTRRVDPEKSAESYRRANEIDPVNPKYATGYAAALVQLRRFAQAEVVLRRVIAAAPNEYTAHANLALALYELKRYAEALPEYEWLARSRPQIAATYFFMATAHDNLGEYKAALEAYEKFLSLADPANNKLDIEKVNLRLPRLRDQISRGQGSKRKQP